MKSSLGRSRNMRWPPEWRTTTHGNALAVLTTVTQRSPVVSTLVTERYVGLRLTVCRIRAREISIILHVSSDRTFGGPGHAYDSLDFSLLTANWTISGGPTNNIHVELSKDCRCRGFVLIIHELIHTICSLGFWRFMQLVRRMLYSTKLIWRFHRLSIPTAWVGPTEFRQVCHRLPQMTSVRKG